MRRRLDLAASLIVTPPVIFLDEPTTGLDPRGRLAMWMSSVASSPKAQRSCSPRSTWKRPTNWRTRLWLSITGREIAKGTADELKTQVGGERLEITVARGGDVNAALQAVRPYSTARYKLTT